MKQNHLTILIASLFSVVAIVGGFSDLAYVPLSSDKAIDITIIAVLFASMIGGYRVGIPLAIIWSIVTHLNLDPSFRAYPLWAIIIVREIFVVSVTWFYQKFRKMYDRSPWNVYRAIFASILVKNLVSIPLDMHYRTVWATLRFEQAIIEIAICTVFMSILIKHLRQIHILNGVRKKEKGEKKHGH